MTAPDDPTAAPLTVLYRDERLIAIDKPVDMAAIPEHVGDPQCLRSRVEALIGSGVWVVHRLDKDVSGVILFALDADMHRALNRLFARREVVKTYLALVHGHVIGPSGVRRQPLREFGSGRVAVDPVGGKPAVTRYRVLKPFGQAFTLLEVCPETGRRHQIRAHLYDMRHPIVGDRRYGDRQAQSAFPRLMLHARRITFTLPDASPLEIDAPAPPLFNAHWPLDPRSNASV